MRHQDAKGKEINSYQTFFHGFLTKNTICIKKESMSCKHHCSHKPTNKRFPGSEAALSNKESKSIEVHHTFLLLKGFFHNNQSWEDIEVTDPLPQASVIAQVHCINIEGVLLWKNPRLNSWSYILWILFTKYFGNTPSLLNVLFKF